MPTALEAVPQEKEVNHASGERQNGLDSPTGLCNRAIVFAANPHRPLLTGRKGELDYDNRR
jgi:hypothetical protein